MKTLDQTDVLSDKDKELLLEVKRIIQGFLPTAEVLLYGSMARGTPDAESDYDILVLTDKALAAKEQNRIRDPIFDLELERDVVISTVIFSKGEWDKSIICVSPFHREVKRDAILL